MAKNKRVPRGTSGIAGKTAAQRRLEAKRAVAAASAAAQAKRRRRFLAVYLPIALVVVVVVALVVTKAGTHKKAPNTTTAASGSVSSLVTSVPSTVLDTVGKGSASSPPTALTGAALTVNNLPRVLYVGAEWCPFCAAERWPLTVALSRFGTFTGLGETKSDPNDTDPNTPTLTYVNATYTSKYLAFSPNEIENGSRQTIKTLSAADQQLFESLTNNQGTFPFVDLGGKYLENAAQYNPGSLAGMSQQQVADTLADPTSSTAKSIDGAANVLTAALCKLTNGQPPTVCTSSGVTAAASTLP